MDIKSKSTSQEPRPGRASVSALDWLDVLFALLLFAFGLYLFTRMYQIQVDMFWHVRAMNRRAFDGLGLWELSYDCLLRLGTLALGLFTRQGTPVAYPAFLALCLVLKYLFLRWASVDYLGRSGAGGACPGWLRYALLALCFAGPITGFTQFATGYWQADVIRLNVWHNPTTVAVAPFALALFYFGYRALEKGTPANYAALAAALLLNLFIKPAFPLCFLPAFLLFLVCTGTDSEGSLSLRRPSFRPFPWKAVLAVAALCVLGAAALWFLTAHTKALSGSTKLSFPYALQSHLKHIDFDRALSLSQERLLGENGDAPTGLVQSVWYVLLYKPFTLLMGLAFPLAAFLTASKRSRRSSLSAFAWGCFATALAIAFLVSQTNEMRTHLNFTWQIPLAASALFFAALLTLAREQAETAAAGGAFPPFRLALLASLFVLHLHSGLLYLERLIFNWSWR